MAADKTITLGHPSYIWRAGQERRLRLIQQYTQLENATILDDGCGVGVYVARFRAFSSEVYGVDIDPERVREASEHLPNIRQASVEALPYPDRMFDVVLSHEVLEHVPNDRAAVSEAHRVLKPGGRLVVFVPNRWYPFETHGIIWRGKYHFGNIPLVNYLPDVWRNKLCPHVRAYTGRGLCALFAELDGHIVLRRRIYAGYDNIIARHPGYGHVLRSVTYAFEHTPLQVFGLSHFLVYQRDS
ncbi:MAG: methyltransferase domain-containing protein [Chloroflexi bacterium]|nr:methyltransferase domain-containing protein [Chloroflexota bacterium]